MYLFGYGYIISWTWFNYVKSKKKFFSFRTQKRNPVWLSVFEREQISYFAVLTTSNNLFSGFSVWSTGSRKKWKFELYDFCRFEFEKPFGAEVWLT